MYTQLFANSVSKLCLDKFKSLPKTGKPKLVDNEWTILSAIVQVNENDGKLNVVALGTGTKCIGSDQLNDRGDILNDSHAEIITRRCFIRYLMEQIIDCEKSNCESIFNFAPNEKRFVLKSGITFHFFTTHSPCGDASIFPKINDTETEEPPTKKIRIDEGDNTGFTGAKLLELQSTDDLDLMSQDTGRVRTKPGKGVRTLSLSCSDKLSRWSVMGIQGALLSSILSEPIYMKTIIFNDGCDYNEAAVVRAIWGRWNNIETSINLPFKLVKPTIFIANNGLKFEFSKKHNSQPSATSIIWINVSHKPLDVSVSGRRQGVTKKNLNTPMARLKIAKIELLRKYIDILNLYPVIKFGLFSETDNLNKLSYGDIKSHAKLYKQQWALLREKVFTVWSTKPANLLNFNVS